MEWKDADYDEKDRATFKWVTILSCDPAYADRVGGEKTVVMISAHLGSIEQAMFPMRDAKLLLQRLVRAMSVNGDPLAERLYENHFKNKPASEEGDGENGNTEFDDPDRWKNGS